MRRLVLSAALCILGACAEDEPEWSDTPGIELCLDVFYECAESAPYTEEFGRCAESIALESGLAERRDTRDCSFDASLGDIYDGLGATAVLTAEFAAAREDSDICYVELHSKECWRYP